ncbi:uncharacterized protein [Argopecten irradians]|uniref:uncharacterized protein n=1 Tax=Argopecten irradians TaxID=31199 RepID=UPI0037171EF8
MSRIVSWFFVGFVTFCCATWRTDATGKFGNCIIYFNGETPPVLENGERTCVPSGSIRLCRETPCPELPCYPEQLRSSSVDKCPSCADTCVHGGNVYYTGQQFQNIDGVNSCSCLGANRAMCSKLPTNELLLCR